MAHVAAIVSAGFVAKLWVVHDVAVNGDTGLYLYDAKQILMGNVQFVEFPSRSPVFEHLLAAAIWVGNSPLGSARALMVVISLLLGICVYVLGRQLHSHRAGLASMAIYYFTPFQLVWGSWVKTEQAAALTTVLAFIVALIVIDRDRLPLWAISLVGGLFAVSYLIRRVAIVHIGAFALFVFWYRHRKGKSIASTTIAALGVVSAALVVLFVSYLLLVRGNLSLTARVFETHSLALLESSGQGSLGWIHLSDPVAVTAEDRTSLFAQVCQKCGVNTAIVFGKTAAVTLPALMLGLVFGRSLLRRLDPFVTDLGVPFALAVAVGYGLWSGPGIGTLPGVTMVLMFLAVSLVWFTKPVPLSDLWSDKLGLPLLVVIALAAGYLYRDRILYTTYFQDFFPFVAVLAGVALVAWLERNRNGGIRIAFVGVLLLTGLVAGFHADPYQPNGSDISNHWFTMDLVDSYGDDMDERLDPGTPVFTAQPLYLIDSEAKPLHDLSRRYYLFRGWPDSPLTTSLKADLTHSLRAGDAPYAINDTNLAEMTETAPGLQETLDEYYCPVSADLYRQTGGELLVHESEHDDCN